MVYPVHFLFGIALVFVAVLVKRTNSAARAKQLSINASWILLAFALVAALIGQLLVQGFAMGAYRFPLKSPLAFLEVFLSIAQLFSFAFASQRSHSKATFTTMLYLMAAMHFFFSTESNVVQALACTAATLVVLFHFRDTNRADAKIFSLYQYAGLALFIAGFGVSEWTDMVGLGAAMVAISVAIRQGLVPFTSGYIHFMEKAPYGLSVLFGILQLGTLCVLVPGLVEKTILPINLLSVIAAASGFVYALLGLLQERGRRAFSYLIASQGSFFTFVWISEQTGTSESLIGWYSVSLATLGFAAALQSIEARRGQLSLNKLGGNFAHTPKMAIACLIFGFASIGFPLTLGFTSIENILQQRFHLFPISTSVCVLALAINSINILRVFFLLFTGRRENTHEPDFTAQENLVARLGMAVLVIGALVPHSVLVSSFS